jgi:putative membrane protein
MVRTSPFDRSRKVMNTPESKSFLTTALAWHGSVSPRVLPRVIAAAAYSAVVYAIDEYFLHFAIPITPFEYSGVVLGLILVMRLNAGHDRWWEARKIWGNIVNQSRNLALVVYGYGEKDHPSTLELLRWIASWPHVMRESLRRETNLTEVTQILGAEETQKIREAQHMPMYVALRITGLLQNLRKHGLDDFTFHRAEGERSALIDAIGACERIRNTAIPLVLAIKTRRFLLFFLALLPLGLVEDAGWLTPLVVALASYPLFSLDEIGAELQNPFSPRNLSHLPLTEICKNITSNILALPEEAESSELPLRNSRLRDLHVGLAAEALVFKTRAIDSDRREDR